ncbi:type II toxin-antitoxin system PemK/MazF family toxin [Rhodopseudomonas palustris]|uniref:Type II toxin-antitoxin system PemK/MazF family toxin n=1 Tax=Rhodopseudomonas palustris TaxID=1076 RepID=A0A323UCU3_RHOPL|nr:type II toxin-antitoxin system PemK/MazF family toxin [Rhodopseudomonas palustris]PZA10017.1 type II toxin-antitoxin system PemK/MazF family toxin [Rhodopseudomonas palustris]
MPINEHPLPGTILICDFDGTFKQPEMVKPRCVVVLSPKIAARAGLCTVVCLSTTPPDPIMSYHCQIDIRPPLPAGWESDGVWVKGDMIYAVGFHRLNLIRTGKTREGKRTYRYEVLSTDQMKLIKSCVLKGLGMSLLTKHL